MASGVRQIVRSKRTSDSSAILACKINDNAVPPYCFSVKHIRISCHMLQVMEWRKDQARREEEAKGLTPGVVHGSRQAVNVSKRESQNIAAVERYPNAWVGEEAGGEKFVADDTMNPPNRTHTRDAQASLCARNFMKHTTKPHVRQCLHFVFLLHGGNTPCTLLYETRACPPRLSTPIRSPPSALL